MNEIRVLDLRSVWGTGGGPDKTILLGASRGSNLGIRTTVCYIRDLRDQVFEIDVRARQLGVDYVEVLERHSFDPSIWPALRRIIGERRIDIVHAHDHKTDLLAWALSHCENVVAMSTAHGFAGDSLKERAYYAVEKRLLARFPRVIAVSSAIKAELVRTGSRPERVSVIPNGIDHRVFHRDRHREAAIRQQLGFGPVDVVIGAVGRLESEKRFDLLIEALAQLRERRPQLRLVIAGDGRRGAELDALIRRLYLEGSCRLLGHQHDMVMLHHAFDLFVQSSSREGTPNAVLEAMAMETPVVATNVGGTRELIVDRIHGRLVRPDDSTAIAEAIDDVVSDRAAAAARARRARLRVETHLSFDCRIERAGAIYWQVNSGRLSLTRSIPESHNPAIPPSR